MANNENLIPIPGRLHSVATEGHVSGSDEIYDDVKEVTQDVLNGAILEEKTYTPTDYSGMGRVVLKKNMVEGVNTLTQDMFYKGEVGSRVPNTNTIYAIQYDFTLAENITIPANCVLQFDGGSLKNGTNNDYVNLNGDYVIIGEDGHTILDYVKPVGCKNEFLNASSIGMCIANKTDNGARFNIAIQGGIVGIKLDQTGYTSGADVPSTELYYLIEQPLRIPASTGKIIGSGDFSNKGSILIPTEDFYINYPDRGVIETQNYWAGLDGDTTPVGFAWGFTISNLQIRCYSRADYGIVVWCCGVNNITERICSFSARKASIFYGGVSSDGRIRRCNVTNRNNDAYGFLFGNHPRNDFAPGYSSSAGGRGTGGGVSIIEGVGDCINWCKADGALALDIVAPHAEIVDKFLISVQAIGGNARQAVNISGGRIIFDQTAEHRTLIEATESGRIAVIVQSMTTYHISNLCHYTNNDTYISSKPYGDIINYWTNGYVDAEDYVFGRSFRTKIWYQQDFGTINGQTVPACLNNTDNATGWMVDSNLFCSHIFRNKLAIDMHNGNGVMLYSLYDNRKYTHISNRLSGPTSLRPGRITKQGFDFDPAIGLTYYDTDINKLICVKSVNAEGVVTWVDATGATV